LADPDAAPGDVAAARAARDGAAAGVESAKRAGAASIASANDAVTLAESALAAARRVPDVSVEKLAVAQGLTARDAAQSRALVVWASTGATVAQGEVVFVPTLPARVQSAPTGVGPVAGAAPAGGEQPGAPAAVSGVVTLSSGGLVAAVTFRPDEQALVRVGMPVELLDEPSNTVYQATIVAVADTATVGTDGQSGFAAVVAPAVEMPLPDELAGTNLRVTITAASTETESLVVPVTAVSSAADGSTFVSVVPAGALVDVEPTVVRVTAGLSADGFVAVELAEAGGLDVGDRVVVGR
jgi:HlyD family secretion protein